MEKAIFAGLLAVLICLLIIPVRVAYFVVGYPNPTQTFIRREVETLRHLGLDVTVFCCRSLRNSKSVANGAFGWSADWWLDFFLELVRIILRPSLWKRAIGAIKRYEWRSWDNFGAQVLGIVAGVALARRIRCGGFDLVHAAWAALPATAALVAAKLTGKRFSFAGHAYDIYRHGGDGWLKLKAENAEFIHTSTKTNRDYLAKLLPDEAGKILVARRGLQTLPPTPLGRIYMGSISILSVGRLVEKKGQHFQLLACSELAKRGILFKLTIVGEGPLRGKLEEECATLGLNGIVHFVGALPYEEVEKLYPKSDIYWHTGITDGEGDRDGLPNAVPEAMAYGVPVIVFDGGGVTEAVIHEETGWIVPSGDIPGLVDATLRMMEFEKLRSSVTQGARRWVEDHFVAEKNVGLLAAAMQKASKT